MNVVGPQLPILWLCVLKRDAKQGLEHLAKALHAAAQGEVRGQLHAVDVKRLVTAQPCVI